MSGQGGQNREEDAVVCVVCVRGGGELLRSGCAQGNCLTRGGSGHSIAGGRLGECCETEVFRHSAGGGGGRGCRVRAGGSGSYAVRCFTSGEGMRARLEGDSLPPSPPTGTCLVGSAVVPSGSGSGADGRWKRRGLLRDRDSGPGRGGGDVAVTDDREKISRLIFSPSGTTLFAGMTSPVDERPQPQASCVLSTSGWGGGFPSV